jgi:hypothetical protein
MSKLLGVKLESRVGERIRQVDLNTCVRFHSGVLMRASSLRAYSEGDN